MWKDTYNKVQLMFAFSTGAIKRDYVQAELPLLGPKKGKRSKTLKYAQKEHLPETQEVTREVAEGESPEVDLTGGN